MNNIKKQIHSAALYLHTELKYFRTTMPNNQPGFSRNDSRCLNRCNASSGDYHNTKPITHSAKNVLTNKLRESAVRSRLAL